MCILIIIVIALSSSRSICFCSCHWALRMSPLKHTRLKLNSLRLSDRVEKLSNRKNIEPNTKDGLFVHIRFFFCALVSFQLCSVCVRVIKNTDNTYKLSASSLPLHEWTRFFVILLVLWEDEFRTPPCRFPRVGCVRDKWKCLNKINGHVYSILDNEGGVEICLRCINNTIFCNLDWR